MKEMKSETTKLTKEFKLEQEQLKNNGTETDKLKSKVEYLKKAHELTGKSVKETEEQLAKAKATYGENSTEVKKLEDKLLNAQIAEQKLANEVKVTSDELKKQGNEALKETSEKLDKFANKTKEIGGTMSKGVTAPIVAVGAAAMLAFNEIDEGLDTIITKTGASGDTMEGFEDSFNKVFGSMPSSAADVGVAIGEVNTRFGVTGETLEGLSKTFLQFAEINGTDLNNAIGTTNKIMKQWNIESEHAGELLGLLTNEGQNTGISVDTLMNSVQQNGAALKSMGFSLKDSVFLLSDMEAAGVNGDVALTSLKKATVNYAKAGKDAATGLKETVENIKNATSETDAMNYATEAFGAKGATEMMKAIREGRFELTDYEAGMEDFATTVEDTFNATLDPPDQLKIAMNNVKLGLNDLAITIFEVAAPAIEKIGEFARNASEKFKGLSDGQKETIVIIGGILAAIGPLLLIIGTLAGSIVNIINVTNTLIPVFKGMALTLSGISLPIVLITAGIALLVAGFIYLWNTNEGFRDAIIEIWNAILETGQNVWGWLVKFFTEDIPNAWQSVLDFFNITVPQWLQSMSDWFAQLPQIVKQWLIDTYNNIVKWGSDTYNNMNQSANNAINAVANWFASLPSRIWQYLINTISNVKSFASNLGAEAYNAGANMFNQITGVISNLPSEMWNIGSNIVKGLWEGISNMTGWLGNKVKSFTSGVAQGFRDGLKIKSPSRIMMEIGGYTTEGFVEGMENKIKNVKETISGIVGTTTDGFNLANNNSLALSSAGVSNMSNYANTSNSNQFVINATVREDGDIDKITDTILYKMENKRRGSAMGKGEY